jgi:hypothetical protein
MAPFRVLSLDGGGSWALIQVKALMALYGSSAGGHQVLSHFDLVAANSGGSIVLGCMIEDFTLQQILDFFNNEAERKAVFSKTDLLVEMALNKVIGIGPRYSSDHKLPALQRVLAKRGNLPISKAVADVLTFDTQGSIHALILAFDYDRNRAAFFRSQPVTGPSWGCGFMSEVTLVEAIHASTNAPVNYFDRPATFPDRPGRYWDGAITGCNNPVLAAVTEAIGLRQAPQNIVALSLGTGSNCLPSAQPGESPSLYTQPLSQTDLRSDVQKLATSVLDDPPDAASFLAHVMTGAGAGLDPAIAPSRIVRMNPLVAPLRTQAGANDPWCPPGMMTEAQFKYILNLDMDAVEPEQVAAISELADLWLKDQARNQPIRMDGDKFTCELGHDNFSTAAAAWIRLSEMKSASANVAPAEVAAP